jgi:[ribosomal protein S18]-alanine N-acetyltransferase
MAVRIEPLTLPEDREWCAQLMASNDPWITLRRDYAACHAALGNPAKERYVVREDDTRAGLLIVDMNGPFPGYIQTICLAPEARNRGIGSQVIDWAEQRILRESPNVFICVSSFNPGALRLYQRLGYTIVGLLSGLFVDEHDEVLLRKSRGSWESFRSGRGSA